MEENPRLTITDNLKALTNTWESGISVPKALMPGKDTLAAKEQAPESAKNDSESPNTSSLPEVIVPRVPGPRRSNKNSRSISSNVAVLQERCRQLCLSLFFREHAPVRSLGFTSSMAGEGKSFLAIVMANILAKDVSDPVTLLECNWEHPCLHEHFGFAPTPGIAEWLRGECNETAIRHRIDTSLTVIPAGNGRRDAVKLIQKIRQKGILDLSTQSSNELLIVDLPAIVTSAYGQLLASLLESLIIVVRAGATTDRMLAETCAQLKDSPVQGVILNQMESKIPRWIRQLL